MEIVKKKVKAAVFNKSGAQFPRRGFGIISIFAMLAPMKNAQLLSLMKQMLAGHLSRNRHFDTYELALVREAKKRQNRLHAISQIFREAESKSGSWDISLKQDKAHGGAWTLTCRSLHGHLIWSAYLQDFEIALLQDSPCFNGSHDCLNQWSKVRL